MGDESDQTVLVTTATLALQAQLANKDIPVAARATAAVLGREPRTEILKGRSNYACLLRVRDQVGGEQETLLGSVEVADAVRSSRAASPESVIGAEVVALREWAEAELVSGGLADRDDAPRHSPRAWAQVSVPVRECLSAAKCPSGGECFVEASRARARQADLVVTNHALLAINAMHGGTALPEHAAVIIDEAHELAARVTGAASSELSPAQIERVAKRASGWLDDELAIELLDVVDGYEAALEEVPPDGSPPATHWPSRPSSWCARPAGGRFRRWPRRPTPPMWSAPRLPQRCVRSSTSPNVSLGSTSTTWSG